MPKRAPKKPAQKPVDWRTLPRKPPEAKKTKRISIAVSEAQLATLHAAARAAGQTMAEYVLSRCIP